MFARTSILLQRAAVASTRRAFSAGIARKAPSTFNVAATAGAVAFVGTAAAAGFNMQASAECCSKKKVDYEAVRAAIAEILDNENYDDGSIGPVLVRLGWHNAGTYCAASGNGGSTGARMRFSPEGDWGANAGLDKARAFLEPIKQRFPGISYSDLWTLAANVAIEEMGGPKLPFCAGRRDAADNSGTVPDGRLPDANQGEQHLRDIFYRMGFNDREIVALSGAHTLGRCHGDRSGFKGPWTRAPTTFSNLYFIELTETKWSVKPGSSPMQYEDPSGELMMLPTDIALMNDSKFRPIVEEYARDEAAFFRDFASAWDKLQTNGMSCPAKKSCGAASAFTGNTLGLGLAALAYLLR